MTWVCPQCGRRADGTTTAPRCVRHFPGADMVRDGLDEPDHTFSFTMKARVDPDVLASMLAPGIPVARLTDPETSHAAAQSVTDLTEKQTAVLELFKDAGPMTDVALVDTYLRLWQQRDWPKQSESGLRTRRHELAGRGFIVDTDQKRRLPSGRWAIVWAAAS